MKKKMSNTYTLEFRQKEHRSIGFLWCHMLVKRFWIPIKDDRHCSKWLVDFPNLLGSPGWKFLFLWAELNRSLAKNILVIRLLNSDNWEVANWPNYAEFRFKHLPYQALACRCIFTRWISYRLRWLRPIIKRTLNFSREISRIRFSRVKRRRGLRRTIFGHQLCNLTDNKTWGGEEESSALFIAFIASSSMSVYPRRWEKTKMLSVLLVASIRISPMKCRFYWLHKGLCFQLSARPRRAAKINSLSDIRAHRVISSIKLRSRLIKMNLQVHWELLPKGMKNLSAVRGVDGLKKDIKISGLVISSHEMKTSSEEKKGPRVIFHHNRARSALC